MLGCRSTTMIWATARTTMMQSCGFTNKYAPFFGSSVCNPCCYLPLFPCCTTPPSHLCLLELLPHTSVSSAISTTFRSFFCCRKAKMSMVGHCDRTLELHRGPSAVRSVAISFVPTMLTCHFQRTKQFGQPQSRCRVTFRRIIELLHTPIGKIERAASGSVTALTCCRLFQ